MRYVKFPSSLLSRSCLLHLSVLSASRDDVGSADWHGMVALRRTMHGSASDTIARHQRHHVIGSDTRVLARAAVPSSSIRPFVVVIPYPLFCFHCQVLW